jgi:hypothetical protein
MVYVSVTVPELFQPEKMAHAFMTRDVPTMIGVPEYRNVVDAPIWGILPFKV